MLARSEFGFAISCCLEKIQLTSKRYIKVKYKISSKIPQFKGQSLMSYIFKGLNE